MSVTLEESLASRVNRSKDLHRQLETLYERYGREVARFAYALTGDRHLAEDVVQEAYVRVLARIGKGGRPDALDSYLKTTILNLVRTYSRRRAREVSSLTGNPVRQEAAAVEPDLDSRTYLWQLMLGLPVRQRAALVLRFYEDLSDEQIGDILQCSPGAAKSLVARGLKTLRKETEESQP